MATGQQPKRQNRKVVAAIAALLAAGVAGYALVLGVADALSRLVPAPAPDICRWVANLAAGADIELDSGLADVGPAQSEELRMRSAWLALYLVAAADRLMEAGDLASAKALELSYFEKHLAAEERRLRAAAHQDITAHLLSDRTVDTALAGLLGWRATIDDRTTPECRAANGKNFRADRMPAIGWPGAVHLGCRCLPGPPVPGAPLLPSI